MPNIPKLSNINYLAGLPAEITIVRIIPHAHCTELVISFPPPAQRICPKCHGSYCVIKDSGRMQTVRHTAIGKTGTLLTFHRRRYLCRECGATYYEPVYWLHPSISITQGLYGNILADLNTPVSIRRIALNNCVTEDIVISVMDSIPPDKPSGLPQTLCIDEFCGESGSYDRQSKRWKTEKYHWILANGDSGSVHDILPRMDKTSLKEYFMEYPVHVRQQVKYVCCDMHEPYISLAKECFPSVTVCLDLFHVVRRVIQGLTETRIRIQQDLLHGGREHDYKMLKNASRILTTAIRNQEAYWERHMKHNQERLRTVLSFSEDLETAYDALQEFYFILEEKEYLLQRTSLAEWIRKYTASKVPEVVSAANTIRHYRGYIQNSLKYGKSNSVAEGRNRAIKEIKRNSYGQHSFENFRKRILLAFGPLKFDNGTYTIPRKIDSGENTHKKTKNTMPRTVKKEDDICR